MLDLRRSSSSRPMTLSPRPIGGGSDVPDLRCLHLSTRQMPWYNGAMKITVVSGDRSVVVKVKGNSPRTMKKAEALATRLLSAGPATPPKSPVGFTGATLSDTEADSRGDEVE